MHNQTPMRELYAELINVSTTARHVQEKSTDEVEVSLASTIEQRIELIIDDLLIEIPALGESGDFENGTKNER